MSRLAAAIRNSLTAMVCFWVATFAGPASADPDVHPWEEDVEVTVTATKPGTAIAAPFEPASDGEPWEYIWLLECPANAPGKSMVECSQPRTCPKAGDFSWVLWGRPLSGQTAASGWQLLTIQCRGNRPQGAPPPQLTPDRVLEAVRRIGLPSLQIQVQPETATLVNFATIFYAEPQPFQRTVGLLGYSVDVRAAPESFHWVFGDRTEATTQQPGAPYPVKDVTHEYTDAHVTVRPRVDVTYQVRYRVDGDAWQALDETLTALGPAISLRIKEATPVLSGGN